MNKSSSLRVPARLQVGMVLEKVNNKNYSATVCDRVTVTAIGLEYFLALDSEGKEHNFPVGTLNDYVMDAWDYEWRGIGEQHVQNR